MTQQSQRAAGALEIIAPAARGPGCARTAQRGRWASMYSRFNGRLIGSALILFIGAYACSNADTPQADAEVTRVSPAEPQSPIEVAPPCARPLPVSGTRMAVDADFPADVLLIIEYGPDGNASPATIDRIEKKYGIELIPYIAGHEQTLGGIAPLSTSQLAQLRCEPGVLSMRYDNPKASFSDVVR